MFSYGDVPSQMFFVEYPCHNCDKIFRELDALKQHVRRVHLAKVFFCFHCKFQTKSKFSLRRHVNRHLAEKKKKSDIILCVLCDTKVGSREEVVDHYNSVHDVDTEGVTLHFDCAVSFEKWKQGIEEADCCRLVPPCGPKKRKGVTVRYYRCFRDGFFKTRGTERRRIKMRGSVKLNGVCPCSIKAEEDKSTGEVRVTYVHTHVGHPEEVGRLNLTKNERAEVARLLALNVPYDAIIDKIRTSFGGHMQRLHLITRKDVWNVQASYNLQKVENGFLHGNDRTSVEAWINTMQKESDIVRFYKPQGVELPAHPQLVKEDMVLVIASSAQLEMLQKFGSNIICFDGTHGLNSYNFELTTIMVLDDLRQGFPCAYMFSNRSDTQIMKIFAEVLKSELSDTIEPNVLMSDMSEIYMKGWSEVMPPPKNFLFCSWHVDRAWKKNLTKIRKIEKRSEVYQMLKTIMFETDVSEFEQLLGAAMAAFDTDPTTSDFGEYFRNTYSQNYKSWAYCYRKECGINTNMFLENMHKVLKYIYLGGKKIKRLDKSISALLRLTRDKFFDQLIAINRGKLTSKVSQIRARHETSLGMKSTIIRCGDGWLISSQSDEGDYIVQETGIQNCVCELKCDKCNICIHTLKCDCIDSVVKARMCKHIHKVCAFIESENEVPFPVPEKEDEFTVDNLDKLTVSHTERNYIEDVIIGELAKKQNFSEQQLENKKSKIRETVDQILENVRSDEHADIFMNALRPVLPTIEALSSASAPFSATQGQMKTINVQKKLSPQKCFVSTKKQKMKNGKMRNPGVNARRVISANLLLTQKPNPLS